MPYKDKEKQRENNRKWKKNNREKIKEWREKNKIKINEQQRKRSSLMDKEEKKSKRKEYYEQNKQAIIQSNSLWATKNRNKINERRQERRNENRDKDREYNRNYVNSRRKSDPLFKLRINIRNLIRFHVIKNGYAKTSKTITILGTDYQTFKEHLESLWEPWMTWDNYGLYKVNTFNYGWDIDHIIPTSTANTEEEVLKLNHYTNLKPLCSKVNRDIKRDIM